MPMGDRTAASIDPRELIGKRVRHRTDGELGTVTEVRPLVKWDSDTSSFPEASTIEFAPEQPTLPPEPEHDSLVWFSLSKAAWMRVSFGWVRIGLRGPVYTWQHLHEIARGSGNEILLLSPGPLPGPAPRVFKRGNLIPDTVRKVRDSDEDEWVRDGNVWRYGHMRLSSVSLLARYGDLTEVTA